VRDVAAAAHAVGIVGAGPTGALLALLLRDRGLPVTLYDSRPDPRGRPVESGRSINLALADRGIHALQLAGVYDDVAGDLIAMRGRMIHPLGGTPSLQPYGRRPDEVIYSVSRHRLNQTLLEAAVRRQAQVRFEHRLEGVDFAAGVADIRDLAGGELIRVPMRPLLAADGAGSTMRRRMAAAQLIEADEADLDHGYKELSIPPGPGGHRMAAEALHIWPRGNFMLIALPNADGSFTATLFLPKRGAVSFEALATPAAIEDFLRTQFPDAHALMPGAVAEFQANPLGFLGTVHADGWHAGAQAALIGDAAHAIVPFHGQGMNCCFEDCLEFDACLGRESSWERVFAAFFAARKSNTDAIAAMALENYLEMRERVADPRFRLQQALALELERRHPLRFIPRYSMVMFHHEIPYRVALDRGRLQERLLAVLTAHAGTLEDVDFERADRDILRDLEPLGAATPP
jgi:kynurenine 3-monooxygenase